jgi:hypothetical protein
MRKQIKVNKTTQGGMGLYAKNEAPTVKPAKPAKKVKK